MSRGNSQTLTINKKSSFFGQKIRSKNATTAPTSEGQGVAYILRLYGTRSEDTYCHIGLVDRTYSLNLLTSPNGVCELYKLYIFLKFRRHFRYHGDSKIRRGIHFTVQLYYTKIAVRRFLYNKVEP